MRVATMTVLSYIVIVFGYLAIVVFMSGMAYRIWNWGRLPTGFSWAVFPKPTKWVVTSVIWKAFAWPTLFNSDRALWVGAVLFHISVLLLLIGHLGLFMNMLSFMERLGISGDASYTIGVAAGIVAAVVLIFFSYRRFFIVRVKDLSSFADHFWLWFLVAVVVIGIYARISQEVSSETVREFAISLVTFRPVLPPENLWFLIHAFLAELFIIYSVAGKPIHMVGQLFTQYVLVTERR